MSATVRFGPYELARRLGSGGMAETFLAVRRGPAGFEQHVCVKRILPAFEADPQFVEQFMEEARLAAQLRHANITQVVDFGAVEGSHYLALELVDGMDLRTLLKRQRDRGERLDAALVAHVGIELANALDFAHTPGRGRSAVVHRDISPSNVLCSRAGEIYLTDFGIARVLGAKRRTESGVVRGKVPYMAAEYARHGTFDARSDLFSVGVLLYESLTGQRPFEGVTDLDTLQRIQAGTFLPVTALRPDAPENLAAIVEHLLHPDPHQRFQTAAALLEALASVSPPPTVSRHLGEVVRGLSESLSQSLQLSLPSRTGAMPIEPAPAYPEVAPADAFERTRTSNPAFAPPSSSDTSHLWKATDPSRISQPSPAVESWQTTDPTQISQHDRPSPYFQAAAASQGPASPSPAYPAASQRPASPSPASKAPLAQTRLMHGSAPGSLPEISIAPTSDPAMAPRSEPPTSRGRGRLVIVLMFGVLAFLVASAAAYLLVHLYRTGAL
ncbi:MAG: protein kinase [Sandaracinaceae bacterium]